ncbi:MAG: hypothetical protein AB7U59_17510 [Desulfovibrionaceae bacterium]
MKPIRRHLPMLIWAAREIHRHPGRAGLHVAALAGLVFVTATRLLFSQALDTTWARLVQAAPDLVVRRVNTGGWAPLPVDEALSKVRGIPGVTDAAPRLWGVAAGPLGPVTVVTTNIMPDPALPAAITPPSAGQAVVGEGVLPPDANLAMTLTGRTDLHLTVIGRFPPDTGMVTQDLVWMAAEDARRLLDIPAGHASDLAVRLFRREEEQAIQADLATALPWPVRITDRGGSMLDFHTRALRQGAVGMLAGIPALLALLLIVTAVVVEGRGGRAHQALLKSMGWTTGDLVRLQVFQALIIATPALLGGVAAAAGMVFWPPLAGITARWITGGQILPVLVLDSHGAGLIVLEIIAMVGMPYLAAVFLTTLRAAAGDPGTDLETAPWN